MKSYTYTGDLKFLTVPTVPEINKLQSLFLADCREHPEWAEPDLYYIHLYFNDNMTGVQPIPEVKHYNTAKQINLILRLMRDTFPEFSLEGTLKGQGEDPDDRVKISVKFKDKVVEEKKLNIYTTSDIIKCPYCNKIITLP